MYLYLLVLIVFCLPQRSSDRLLWADSHSALQAVRAAVTLETILHDNIFLTASTERIVSKENRQVGESVCFLVFG